MRVSDLVAEGGLDATVGDAKADALLRDAGVVVLRGAVEADVMRRTKGLVEEDATRPILEGKKKPLLDGRVDVKVESLDDESVLRKAVEPLVKRALTEDAVLAAAGVVVRGSRAWHRDGNPLFPGHCALPAHALTAFFPLVPDTVEQFLVASHHAAESDDRLESSEPYAAPSLEVGDVVVFDFRVRHRLVSLDRPMLFMVFTRPWFVTSSLFPAPPPAVSPTSSSSSSSDEAPSLLAPPPPRLGDDYHDETKEEAFVMKEPWVYCVDEDARYSERALARTPSGQLPRKLTRQRNCNDDRWEVDVEFEGLRGPEAVRALERRCGFRYAATAVFLRARDLRDRQLLFSTPSPRASDLGVDADLAARRVAPLEVKSVPQVRGFGLFARDDVPAGSFVAEYAGLVAPSKNDRAFDGYALDYAQALDGTTLRISARDFGSVARFVNHDPERPNAAVVAATPPSGLRRVLIITTSPIRRGDQILVDYGPAYWHGADVVPVQLHVRDDEEGSSSSSSRGEPTTTTTRRTTTTTRRASEDKPMFWSSLWPPKKGGHRAVATSLRGLASSVLRAIDVNEDPPDKETSTLSAWRDLDTW